MSFKKSIKGKYEKTLPTYEEVVKFYEQTRRQIKLKLGYRKEMPFLEITDVVARNIDMNIDISFRRFAFTSGIDVERILEGMENIVS